MRAFVLLALLALASASAPTGGSGYDECPAAPARPGDRRKGDPRTFTLAVQRASASSLGEAIDGASDDARLELARSRLERAAADITALDADFVHVTGVDGCAALNALVAASTAIDARVAGDYRPYLVAPETAPGGGFPATAALLTRVDPTESVYLAPGSDGGEPGESSGFPSFPHYFARTRLGRVGVVIAGVASATRPDVRRGAAESWAAEALAIVARGEEVIVVGADASFLEDHPLVASFLRTNAFARVAEPTSADGSLDAVWTSPRVAAALIRRSGGNDAENNGVFSHDASSPIFARLEFKPGAFTNEAETVAEYLTPRRVFLTACEATFAAVFFPGVVALAFPKRRGAEKTQTERKKTR